MYYYVDELQLLSNALKMQPIDQFAANPDHIFQENSRN